MFNLSHYILSLQKEKEKNISFKQLELFYQTFFFYEFNEEDETNNFTFYKIFPENLVDQNKYETYLFNIGFAILSKNYNTNLIEILFSKETPIFLKNIILVCFQYIRASTKNADDFISLCVPCLNHYNLYYLLEGIKQDLNYHITKINQINYSILEKFLNEPNNNNIINEEPKGNFINVNIQINDKGVSKVSQEDISKYFCFPDKNDKDNVSLFFTPDNLNKNKDKFLKLINSNNKNADIYNICEYTINYDNPQINDKNINAFSLMFLLKY